ncbi:hypothetical protein J1N09_14010 [Aureitalea sp. L0-47]|uniref:tetratricopeptide repeat protein n=1 Tax=Aureitalea sp. L0-47 TaxID=2816962 RepID=UPI002238721D|nr:tetratricopeptide repeat protein [Aureitalea sp. L0-47]MCW5520960.1 hypothetical protein [Aureitalea sp. L0-47]
MSVTGSFPGMMSVIRNNARLLRKKKLFKKSRSMFDNKPLDFGGKGAIPNEGVDPIVLRRIRERTIRERGRRRLKFAAFLIVALPVIFYLGYKTFHNFSFGLPALTVKENSARDLSKEFIFYINDGDAWLKKWHYHNALFQYNKALELYPGDYDARYRIAIAYSYQCQYEFTGCEKGKTLVEELKREFPNRSELLEVEKVFTHWGTP